jgi:23S rRNA C2498 (ribose-2'-O)-methylase RlmM
LNLRELDLSGTFCVVEEVLGLGLQLTVLNVTNCSTKGGAWKQGLINRLVCDFVSHPEQILNLLQSWVDLKLLSV